MSLRYKKLTAKKDFDIIVELCGRWWEEANFFKQTGITYNVSRQQFLNLEQAGLLIVLGGFDSDGNLATCFVAAKQPFIYNENYTQSTELVWHVRPDVRSFKTLAELLEHVEITMIAHEVDFWNLSLPPEHLATEKGLSHFGYFKQDTHYMKFIGTNKGDLNG